MVPVRNSLHYRSPDHINYSLEEKFPTDDYGTRFVRPELHYPNATWVNLIFFFAKCF